MPVIPTYGTRKTVDQPVPTINPLTVDSGSFGKMTARGLEVAGNTLERTSNQAMNIFTDMANQKAKADSQQAFNQMSEASIKFENELLTSPLEAQTKAIEATKKFYDEQKMIQGESLISNQSRDLFNASFERSRLSALQSATRLQMQATEKYQVQGWEVMNANLMQRQALQPLFNPEETAVGEAQGMANVRAIYKGANPQFREQKAEEWRNIYYKGGFSTLVKQGRGDKIWDYYNKYKDKFLPSELKNLRLQSANTYSDYMEKQFLIRANLVKNPKLLTEIQMEINEAEKNAKELTDEYIQQSLKDAENPDYDYSDPLKNITKRGLSRISTGVEFMINNIKLDVLEKALGKETWSSAENIELYNSGTIDKSLFNKVNKINAGKEIQGDAGAYAEWQLKAWSTDWSDNPQERVKQKLELANELALFPESMMKTGRTILESAFKPNEASQNAVPSYVRKLATGLGKVKAGKVEKNDWKWYSWGNTNLDAVTIKRQAELIGQFEQEAKQIPQDQPEKLNNLYENYKSKIKKSEFLSSYVKQTIKETNPYLSQLQEKLKDADPFQKMKAMQLVTSGKITAYELLKRIEKGNK